MRFAFSPYGGDESESRFRKSLEWSRRIFLIGMQSHRGSRKTASKSFQKEGSATKLRDRLRANKQQAY